MRQTAPASARPRGPTVPPDGAPFMRRYIQALVLGATLVAATPAAAQFYPAGGWYRPGPSTGYWVQSSGYYNGPGPAPWPGRYEAYYGGRPLVTVTDPWGRIADVPLRPKVLYYSDQLLTPGGGFYP